MKPLPSLALCKKGSLNQCSDSQPLLQILLHTVLTETGTLDVQGVAHESLRKNSMILGKAKKNLNKEDIYLTQEHKHSVSTPFCPDAF